MKHKKRRWILLLIPVILVAGFFGWRIWNRRSAAAVSTVVQQRTARVERGTLEVTLSGSGSVQPVSRTNLKTEADGPGKGVFMTEGQAVKKGDVLLTLEQDNSLAIQKLQNTLRQKELAYRDELEKAQGQTVKAPISGQITEISVQEGDSINPNTALMTIIDKSSLSAEVKFENVSLEKLSSSGQVTVHVPDYMTTIPGEILSMQQNGNSIDVCVLVENPGALQPGTVVWCEAPNADGSITSTSGTLKWHRQETLKADISGTVGQIHAKENQTVDEDTLLLTVAGDSSDTELENARLAMEEARNNLEETLMKKDKSSVIAPMDGYLVSVSSLVEGETVKEGTTVAVLVNTAEMVFDISIDELDINRVEPGLEVQVYVEAIEETKDSPLIGTVKSIAPEGKTQNGVTSYSVTITIPGREGLKVGMNVDASVQVAKKENTLMVPLEALQKQGDYYFVWVKREGGSDRSATSGSNGNNPTGAFQLPDGRSEMPGSGGSNGNTGAGGFQLPDGRSLTEEERNAMRERLRAWNGSSEDSASGSDQGNMAMGRAGNGGFTTSGGTAQAARSQQAAGGYYDGAVPVRVETGIYNESYMEIISGLSEGETVVLPRQTSNSSAGSQTGSLGGFGMPFGTMGGTGGFNSIQGGRQ